MTNRITASANTNFLNEMKAIIKEGIIGVYIHGSLAMGGFNPHHSDIDILVVTKTSMSVSTKKNLVKLLLKCSSDPFPIEISFLTQAQLDNWQHPSPFDFHYGESWRANFEEDLANETYQFLNEEMMTDGDLAAHITITNNRGICVEGKPINEVFPGIPRSHYLSSIIADYQDCFKNIQQDPIYCTLNLLRVFWYLKEDVISSKQEAGEWGFATFPPSFTITIQKIVSSYSGSTQYDEFEKDEILQLRDYIADNVQRLLS